MFTAVKNVTWTSWNFCVPAVCVGTMNLVLAINWESWFHLWWIIYLFARIVLPQVWKASKRTKQVSINTVVSVFNNSMKQRLPFKKVLEFVSIQHSTSRYIALSENETSGVVNLRFLVLDLLSLNYIIFIHQSLIFCFVCFNHMLLLLPISTFSCLLLFDN